MSIVEVFRTNVMMQMQAVHVINTIVESIPLCKVNFDLDDCDRVMRVVSAGPIDSDLIIRLVHGCGFDAEILPDVVEEPVHVQFMAS
jgi:hypothetical protein